MAWYYGTFSCEHDGRVNVVGPGKQRKWKIEHAFSNVCDACFDAQTAARREEENRLAAEAAKEQELPGLTGSAKQVAFAETMRQKLLLAIETFVEKIESGDRDAIYLAEDFDLIKSKIIDSTEYMLTITSAGWWIDNGRHASGADELCNLLAEMHEKLEAKKIFTAPVETDVEAAVRPEDPVAETAADICIVGADTIQIVFSERRDDFRELVKNTLAMKWNGRCWERRVGVGSIQDRAAEAGHRLLAAGFPVRIQDETIRKNAISGVYEPECMRWVVSFSKGPSAGKIGITWDRKDDFYAVAKRLPGSRWASPYVIVSPEYFDEVLDFAERHGFKISPLAQKVIGAAREAREKMLKVNVPTPRDREPVVASTAPPLLEVKEFDIDESLRD